MKNVIRKPWQHARTTPAHRGDDGLPQVSVSDDGVARYLHLGTPWVQGSMRLKDPFEIDLEYVQRMMAWLLFVDPDSVAERHAVQLGLGAAALTKFHYKKLEMQHHRDRDQPAGGQHLPQLVQAAAGQRHAGGGAGRCLRWRSSSPTGKARSMRCRWICTTTTRPLRCWTACRVLCRLPRLLTPEGSMTVNLFGRASSYQRSLDKITEAFGAGRVSGPSNPRAKATPWCWRSAAGHAAGARGAAGPWLRPVQARWGLPAQQVAQGGQAISRIGGRS